MSEEEGCSYQTADSDEESDDYLTVEDDEDTFEDDVDGDPDYEDDDLDDGQLVVDEKPPTQSSYMLEKSKRKKVMVGGKLVSAGKPHRMDKGRTRLTAYMMWSKEVRQELKRQYPNMDFTTMARRLSELWGTVPNSEREIWRRKAKREAAKKSKMQARKFINKKLSPIPTARPIVPQQKKRQYQQKQLFLQQQPLQVVKLETIPEVHSLPPSANVESVDMSGLYKVTGVAPIDLAAHLTLLGESLLVIGEKLQAHDSQIAVSGSLSVLLDSLLCATAPLISITNQVPELQPDPALLSETLQNISYLMPGLW